MINMRATIKVAEIKTAFFLISPIVASSYTDDRDFPWRNVYLAARSTALLRPRREVNEVAIDRRGHRELKHC
jgi:hypothetical protein